MLTRFKFSSLLLSATILIAFATPTNCKVSRDSSAEELKSIARSIGELPNPTEDQLLDQANAYRWLKDYKSAISTLDKLLKRSPSDGMVWAFRGVMYKFDGRYKDAKNDLDTAEKLGYRRTNLYAERSAVELGLADWAGALADGSRAASMEPKNANHLVLVADAKAKLGKPEDGLADINRALELESNNASALAVRAWIYEKLGRSKQAKLDTQGSRSLGREASP